VEALDYLFGTGKFTGRDVSSVPKLILLDLKLPRLNGLEVLQRLRKEPTTRLVPVIILTSSNEVEDIISSYKFGANSYIRKQVEFESFANTIKELGTYWLSINQTVTH
jgi:CheY-like chemotaxis protein